MKAHLPCLLLALAGCTHVQKVHKSGSSHSGKWALLPVMNFSEAPQAGDIVQTEIGMLLRSRGTSVQELFAPPEQGLPEVDEHRRVEQSLSAAKQRGFAYALTGMVKEWRYREGTDGEPVVAMELRVIDVATGEVDSFAAGTRTGWGRETLSDAGQSLLESLLSELEL